MPDEPTFVSSLAGVDASMLGEGFFEGWPDPPSPDQHLALLNGSNHVVLARGGSHIVGFVNAISDGVLSAYIPLLEVLPSWRGQGIGTRLVTTLLGEIGGLYMVDVMCDYNVLPFYEAIGFQRANGAVLRNYNWRR